MIFDASHERLSSLVAEARNASAPAMESQRVRLRPIVPSDYEFVMAVYSDPATTHQWRSRGASLSPEALEGMLWQGVLVQFLVERLSDGEPLGLISAYNPDFRNGTAYLAQIMRTVPGGTRWGFEAFLLFSNYLLCHFDFRKLYAESSEISVWSFASGEGRFFEVEGRLKDHEYYDGRFWDRYLLAFWRDTLVELLAEFLPQVQESPDQRIVPS